MDFFAVLGGVAAAASVLAGLSVLWRRIRARKQRADLKTALERVTAGAEKLRDTTVEIDHRMSEGVGWGGWAVWPDQLRPLIAALDQIVVDAEAIAAETRGADVEARVERLRADVEGCALLFRTAADIYRSSTITNYRATDGKPCPPGATGRDLTVALTEADMVTLGETRREFTRLVRSCLYQSGESERARTYEPGWPVTRAEVFAADTTWTPPNFPPGTEQAPPIAEL